MAETKSVGLSGLSHYRNSRASTEMYEPVYKSHFIVNIALPVGVGSSTENTNLLLEGVTKVTGLDSHKFPSELVTQTFKWAQRRFVGGKPTNTTMDLGLDIEVNLQKTKNQQQPSAYVIKTLRKWCDLAYDCQTGGGGVKADYTAPWMTIQLHDRAYNTYWMWKCYDVFPMSKIDVPDLEYNNNDIHRIQGWKLAVDYYDEIIY